MENNQNQNTNVTGGVVGGAQSAASGFVVDDQTQQVGMRASFVETPNAPLSGQNSSPEKPDRHRLVRVTKWLALIIGLGGLIGLVIYIFAILNTHNSQVPSNNLSAQFSTQNIALNQLDFSDQGLIMGESAMTVNGSLHVKQGLVVTPTTRPASATTGQIYFDQNTNQLTYYNGSSFVSLMASGPVIQSIGGLSGQVSLGGGLGVVNNQLVDNGVLTFGGQNGNIAIGGGLTMNGAILQNTGILSLSAGSPNVELTNNGSGNISIKVAGAGTGTVTSPGGTAGRIPLFNSSQDIGNSILSQSGSTVTITGDLNIVTGGLSLGNPLTVSNGGTGSISLAPGGVIIGHGTAALSSITTDSPGLCLLSTLGAPAWGACAAGGGVTTLNGLSGGLSVANASAADSIITIDNASTSNKGIASFNSTNFFVSAGVVNTIQDINTTAAPSFGRLTLTSSQAASPMLFVNNTNAGASGALLDLQHSGISQFAVSPSGVVTTTGAINGQTISATASFSGTLGVSSNTTVGGTLAVNGGTINSTGALAITPSGTLSLGSSGQTLALQGGSGSSFVVTSGANTTTLNFQAPGATVTYRIPTAAAGSYDICTTAGNCNGLGGTVSTPGGSNNKLAKFTGGQTIADSSITDNGTAVTTSANLIVQGGQMTVGVANSQTGTLNLAYGSGNFSGSLSVGTLTGNQAYTLPNASGAVCLDSNNCGYANRTLSNLSGVAINTSLLPGSATIDLGSNSAPFRNLYLAGSSAVPATNNFEITGTPSAARVITLPDASGTVCLAGTSACGFAAGSGAAFVQGGNNFGGIATLGNNDNFGLNIKTNGTTALGLAANGDATFSGSIIVNGSSLTTGAFSITPSGLLTIGASSQTLALQGGASSSFAVTNGANTTTLNFQAPGANVTYRLATTTAGSYDICTTANNCSGLGGSVSTPGGNLNRLAKFTGGQVIGDSSITDNGSTVTTTGNLVVQGGVATVGVANSQTGSINLAYGGANFTGGIVLTTLTDNRTYTLPNASGTICLDSGNCLGGPGGGANTSLSNLGTVAINTSLLPGSTTIDLGSGAASFRDIYLAGSSSTPGTNNFKITGASTGGTRTITLPDVSGTVCLQSSTACNFAPASGSNSYIQNGTGVQTANFSIQSANSGNIAGIIRAASGQTADVFQVQNSTGSALFKIAGNTNLATIIDNLQIDGQDTSAAALLVKGSNNGGGALLIDTQRLDGTSVARITNDGQLYLGNNTGVTGLLGIEDNTHYGNFTGLGVLTHDQSYYLPDASGTICLDSNNCSYIKLQGSTPGSSQTGNINISGTAIAGTAMQAPAFDTAGATALTVGSTNASSVTIGKANTTFTLQGNATSTITSTDSGHTTTLSFQAPAANVTYRLLTAAQGSYDICTSAGNCGGTGNVTTAGGTTGTLAVFTGGTAIGDSLLSQATGTVTVNGNLSLTAGNKFQINGTQISSANLSNDSNLAKLSTSQIFSGNTETFKNTVDSTNAFAVQNAAGNAVLSIDTSNGQAVLGASSLVDGKLVLKNNTNNYSVTLGTASLTGDRSILLPNAGGVICTDSGNCAGVGATLQTAYNFSTGGTTPKIKVNGTLLGVDIQDADSTIGADLFDIRASNAGLGGLGSVMFGVGNTGQITLQNSANSTTAMQILTQGGTKVMVADTTNGQIALGQSTTLNGKIVFNNSVNSYNVTLSAPNTTGSSKAITLPNEAGVLCIQNSTNCGFAITSGSTAYIQNGTTLQASANFNIDGTGQASTLQAKNVVIKPSADALATPSLQIQTSTSQNLLTVASSGTLAQVGINLGSTTLPSLAGNGLQIQGALALTGGAGSNIDHFHTPGSNGNGSNGVDVNTKINIPFYDPGDYGQLIAMGLPQDAYSTARGISLFDGRLTVHQPTIAVISPDEQQIMGLSWDGSNSNSRLKTSGTNLILQPGGVDALGVSSTTVNLYQNTVVASGKTVTIQGNTSITSTATTAFQVKTGGTGVFTVDTSNNQVVLGNSSTANGNLAFANSGSAYTISLSAPTAAGSSKSIALPDASGVVCLQSSASCGFMVGSASSFIQNGASLQNSANFNIDGTGKAAAMQAGTFDAAVSGSLTVGNSNATSMTIGTNAGTIALGKTASNTAITLNGTTLVKPTAGNDSTTAFQIQSAAGTPQLTANTTVNIATAPAATISVAAGSNQGGTLSGSGANTYYYRVTGVTAAGEVAASPETAINGRSFTAIAAPAGTITTSLPSVAGNVSCNGAVGCVYSVTFVTANGETTAAATSAARKSVSAKKVPLSNIPTGATGTIARNIYRNTNGGGAKLCFTINDNVTTSIDDNTMTADCTVAPPSFNTATTNTNNATITFGAVTGATSYKIYRGTSPDAETAYQTTASSPFTDTGATGTGGTLPTGMQFSTNAYFQNATDSTTSLQVNNAAGTSVLTVDTSNQRVAIGSGGGTAAGQLYVGPKIGSGVLGAVTVPGGLQMSKIVAQGKYVYAAGYDDSLGNSYLYIFDVSNPASPVLLSSSQILNDWPADMAVQGKYVYTVGTGGVLTIIDVSNPYKPQQTSSSNFTEVYYSVYAQGRYLYAGGNDHGSPAVGIIDIIDIGNPYNPTWIGQTGAISSSTSVAGLYGVGDTLYATEADLAAAGYTNTKIEAFDISIPTNLTRMGNANLARSSWPIAVSGHYIYSTSDLEQTIQVTDMSNPDTPSVVTTIATGPNSQPEQLSVQGNLLYVALKGPSQIGVYDITSPTAPLLVGTISTGADPPNSIAVQGRYAYTMGLDATLQTYDIGGAYIQQLETGGLQTDTLQVNGNSNTTGDASIQGSLSVSQSLQVNSGFTAGGVLNVSGPGSGWRDDFSSTTLNANNWTWTANGGSYSLSANPGHLRISVPGSTSHDCWSSGAVTCVRMMRPINSEDANMSTMFQMSVADLTTNNTAAGIMLWEDANNFLRFEFTNSAGSRAIYMYKVEGGSGSFITSANGITLGSDNYIRVVRNGLKYDVDYYTTASGWVRLSTGMTSSVWPTQVGLYGASNATAFTTDFDYIVAQPEGLVTLQTPWMSTTNTPPVHLCINMAYCYSTLGVTGTIVATSTITQNGSPDIAETIPAAPDVTAGDVVMADPNNAERVVKSSGAYNSTAIGVISDGTSGFLTDRPHYGKDYKEDPTAKPLVLAGRLPVKVTNEGGVIKPGDYLTTSSTPGYAMKASKAGPTIGKALDFFNGDSGTVLTLINLSYYTPTGSEAVNTQLSDLQGQLAQLGAQINNGQLQISSLNVTGNASIGGNLEVGGTATVTNLVINGHLVTGGKTPAVQALPAAGSDAHITVTGNDTSGTITFIAGQDTAADDLAKITFSSAFQAAPQVTITPVGKETAKLDAYIAQPTTTSFIVGAGGNAPTSGQTYQINYHVLQ